jgi:hypothetical protein
VTNASPLREALPTGKRVLAIGDGAAQIAKQLYPAASIDTAAMRPNGKYKRVSYDALLAYHILPKLSYLDARKALTEWVGYLRPEGEIQLYVPSLEWAAEQVLSDKPSPALAIHLFGNQRNKDFFISGYTMRDLRKMCENAGIAVTQAVSGEYTLGEEVCELHLIVGVKKSTETAAPKTTELPL